MAKSAPKSTRTGASSGLPLRVLFWVSAVCLACLALCLGLRAIWRAIAERPEFRVNPRALTLKECPEWVNEAAMTRQLQGLLRHLPRGTSVFSKDLAHVVGRELGQSPWLSAVTRVQRKLPNSLSVKAIFRKPSGLVLLGGRQYMVDNEGFWLPETLFSPPGEWHDEHTPVIADRLLRERPVPGRRWDGPRLAVGARLCEFFRRKGLLEKLELASIDVTGVGRSMEPEIVLTTADGVLIKWGNSTVYELVSGLEAPVFLVPDQEKLGMLLSKLQEYPGLKGIRYLDLRFHGQIVFAESL